MEKTDLYQFQKLFPTSGQLKSQLIQTVRWEEIFSLNQDFFNTPFLQINRPQFLVSLLLQSSVCPKRYKNGYLKAVNQPNEYLETWVLITKFYFPANIDGSRKVLHQQPKSHEKVIGVSTAWF